MYFEKMCYFRLKINTVLQGIATSYVSKLFKHFYILLFRDYDIIRIRYTLKRTYSLEGKHLKKIMAALIAITFIMSPIGDLILSDHGKTVEARGYKSGRKSFNNNNYNRTQRPAVDKRKENNSSYNKSQNTTNKTKSTAGKKRGFFSGGLMRGLFIGGLAGLLFGGIFANMGAFGSLLGLLINVIAIVFVFNIVRSIFAAIRTKKRNKDTQPWRS